MKITQLEINWMQGYGNSPRVTIFVDELPKFDPNEPIWNRTKHNYIWAEKGGLIQFMVYTPRSNDKSKFLGFAGTEFKKTLKDGTVLESNNWWSGGAYGLVIDGINCVDVIVQEEKDSLGFSGFAITLDRLSQLLELADGSVHIIRESFGGHYHYVVSSDRFQPCKPKDEKVKIITIA